MLPKHRTHFWYKNVWLSSDIWFIVCFLIPIVLIYECLHLAVMNTAPPFLGMKAWSKILSQISQSSVSFQIKGAFLDSRRDRVYTRVNRICLFSHFAHAITKRIFSFKQWKRSGRTGISLDKPLTRKIWQEWFAEKKIKKQGNAFNFQMLFPNTVLPEMLEGLVILAGTAVR